jgi:O-acetyl-ADP-ribose deacetylase (regulator of RNase III)
VGSVGVIQLAKGNLLRSETEALINAVNCVGHMGKGIALQFKKAFHDNFLHYQNACRAGEVQPGRMLVFETGKMIDPRFIINFPTKQHWRGNSKYEYIQSGLEALIAEVRHRGIRSIALPPLGCGLGGLEWNLVRPMIEAAFSELPDVEVLLFEPAGAPEARTMPIGTHRPKMTVARALFIKLMEQYLQLDYRLTLLEIQKLAYFLQEAGEPLKLRYEAGIYGPYAQNLNKVLEILEGHMIRGYGDTQRPDVEIELLPGAVEEADRFLEDRSNVRDRLDRVGSLIAGFETPYGMELLASIHWLARHDPNPIADAESAIQRIAAWSERKARMFKSDHIRFVWNRLASQKWIPASK